MKKIAIFAFISFFLTSFAFAADAVRSFTAEGKVVTVDPVYSQITIEHGAIKDFAQDGRTDFYVSGPDLLKGIATNDLVDFEFTDTKGDVKIGKITKTGTAPPEEEGIPLGQAVQQTLAPLAPVNEAVGGAADSAAALTSTDPKIKDGEIKQKLATF